MTHPTKPRFAPFISRVNAILAHYPAFRRGENCQFVDAGHSAVIAAFRQDTRPLPDTEARKSGFLVVCNLDTLSPQRIAVNLTPLLGPEGPYPCRELLGGEVRIILDACLELLLPPCTAQVLMFSVDGEGMEEGPFP